MWFNLATSGNTMPVSLRLGCHWLEAMAFHLRSESWISHPAWKRAESIRWREMSLIPSVHFWNPEDLQNTAPQIKDLVNFFLLRISKPVLKTAFHYERCPKWLWEEEKSKTLRTHTLKKKNLLWIKVLTFCPTNLF